MKGSSSFCGEDDLSGRVYLGQHEKKPAKRVELRIDPNPIQVRPDGGILQAQERKKEGKNLTERAVTRSDHSPSSGEKEARN